jgi:hypothetical protein
LREEGIEFNFEPVEFEIPLRCPRKEAKLEVKDRQVISASPDRATLYTSVICCFRETDYMK